MMMRLSRSLFVLWSLFGVGTSSSSSSTSNNNALLNEDSTVLITGAAGFIGSELAIALYRTFNTSLVLVDSLDQIPLHHASSNTDNSHNNKRSEADLALLEFRRQRLFRVLQTCGSKAHVYRTDIRPTIPEYFDQGQVAVLPQIFQNHQITHIVHLADPYHRANLEAQQVQDVIDNRLSTQAVPRRELETKAGLMEALLEQIRLHHNTTNTQMPQFVYASSWEVYHATPGKTPEAMFQRPNPPPFTESKPITTPNNLGGASKLLDEILAQTYFDLEGIPSIGLRYFSVYGPWGLPGSPMFEMADRAANDKPILTENERNTLDHLRDFVYIDDAIDATLAALQLPHLQKPLVINVGTGQALSYRQVAKRLNQFNPKATLQGPPDELVMRDRQERAWASTERAQELLGFTPRIDIDQGLKLTLGWHYDRAFPYGSPNTDNDKNDDKNNKLSGIEGCHHFDQDCLLGAPIFACASECAHAHKCLPTMLDDVVGFSRMLTASCDVVLYTVDLRDDLQAIPSATIQVSQKSQSHVKGGQGSFCNIALVSETSPLVQTLKRQGVGETLPLTGEPVLMNGFWALVPVSVSDQPAIDHAELLVKLSPSTIVHENVQLAIYADPYVIFDDLPRLVEEASMQPKHAKINGATAILMGQARQSTLQQIPRYQPTPPQQAAQNQAYRLLRMALHDELSSDGFVPVVDSSFLVHALVEDARLWRCDVYGEVVQWNVTDDQASMEFILGLHDMWSNVMARKRGNEPWWHGDAVETVPSGAYVGSATGHGRRLEEATADQEEEKVETEQVKEEPKEESKAKEEPKEESKAKEEPKEEVKKDTSEKKSEKVEDTKEDSEKEDGDEQEDAAGETDTEEAEASEFGLSDHLEDEEGEDDDDVEEEVEEEEEEQPEEEKKEEEEVQEPKMMVWDEEDNSSYDTWLGILSSGTTPYFARIVSWEAVGAVHLEDYSSI